MTSRTIVTDGEEEVDIELHEHLGDSELRDEQELSNSFSSRLQQYQAKRKKRNLVIAGSVISMIILLIFAIGIILYYKREFGGGNDHVTGPWENVRLPTNVYPTHYRLNMNTNMSGFHFNAHIEIDIEVTAPTKYILVHSLELQINSVSLVQRNEASSSSQSVVTIDKFEIFPENEFLVVFLPKEIEIGKYTLSIDYEADLNRKILSGFYVSTYTTNGETRYMASTDFEPTDARRAFPCFDEPAMKAKWTITMSTEPGYKMLSNMNEVATTTLPSGWIQTQFAESVPMSTYLVALVVCDFDYVNTTTPEGVLVRVWARPGIANQGLTALNAGARIVSYFAQYFGAPYPLPKVDMIAIPDFTSGAMENWGLITFRETALLVDPIESSTSDKQRAVTVVAHELAHQWFGNLVTMKWWSDLWLNEGFASYVEYLGTDHVYPNWEMMDQFVILDYLSALSADSSNSTHAISQHVVHPSDIQQMFDSISYDKGASILRMLSSFIGQDKFVAGLQLYLQRFKYQNSETKDLWQAISETSGLNITEIMTTWTNYIGYPIIKITKTGPTTLTATQSRFFVVPPNGTVAPEQPWWVPLNYISASSSQQVIPLNMEKVPSVTITDNYREGDWYKFNVNQTGFYRVLYPEDMLESLHQALLSSQSSSQFAPSDKAGLIDDVFSFQRAGLLGATTALRFIDFVKNETDYVVLSSALAQVSRLSRLMDMQPCYGAFEKYALSLIDNAIAQIGLWDVSSNDTTADATTGDSHLVRLLRATLLGAAVQYHHAGVIEEAKQRYTLFEADPVANPLHPDLRLSVYRAVVAGGGDAEYESMLNRYINADLAAEKQRCLIALAAVQKPYLIHRTLSLALPGSIVRGQDVPTLLAYVSINVYAREFAWSFIKQNWDSIYERFGGGYTIGRIISGAASYFASQYHYDDVKSFFESHPAPSGASSVSSSLERILENMTWLSKNSADVCTYVVTANTAQ